MKTSALRNAMSITRCPSGCICLQFGPAMIHLTLDEFRAFVSEASYMARQLEQGAGSQGHSHH